MAEAKVLEIIGKRPVGGVGTVMLNYHRHIDTAKIQMDYLIFGEEEEVFDQEVAALGATVYRMPALSGRKMKQTKQYLEQFFSEHAKEYDIVHLHAPYIAKMVFDVAEKYKIKHRIVHSHATLYAESKIKAVRNCLLWSISQGKITNRIACSKAAGDFLFQKKEYVVLKNAIDIKKYAYDESMRDNVRQKEGIAPNQYVIGNVGRLSMQKNQTYLIDIFAKIKEQCPNAVLWLLGDGPTRAEIEAKINEYKLCDVKLFGMTDLAKDYYQAMDIMVMPSLFEGLPMVGVEAQASGLPCVFSDAITREVDVVGCPYLKLTDSPAKWARVIVGVLGQNADRTISYDRRLQELGFDIDLEAKRLEEYYVRLAK